MPRTSGFITTSRGWNGGFYDRDNNYHVVNGGILINNPPSASQAQTTVVCDQCGSWDITYRRKNPLPPAQLKLSEAVLEFSRPKAGPGPLQAVEMVAECQACGFTVEYSKTENVN